MASAITRSGRSRLGLNGSSAGSSAEKLSLRSDLNMKITSIVLHEEGVTLHFGSDFGDSFGWMCPCDGRQFFPAASFFQPPVLFDSGLSRHRLLSILEDSPDEGLPALAISCTVFAAAGRVAWWRMPALHR
jgi:hypothetical protein